MVQTTFRTDSDSDEERITVPLGTVRLVRSGFRRYRLEGLLDGMMGTAVRFSKIIENLCISALHGDSSMLGWSARINRTELTREYYCDGMEIRHYTFQRALEELGDHLEEVTEHLVKVSRVLYPDLPTHAYIDGSHVKRNGSAGPNVKVGEGGGTLQLQDQFMVASMVATGVPVSIELYPGNLNDPPQFSDFVPQLLFLLKKGSMVIMDNGGSSSDNLSEISDFGDVSLTRKRLNASDERIIREEKDRMVYVGMNTACISSTFESSGRTRYLYFSGDSYAATLARADRILAAKELERKRAQTILTDRDPGKYLKVPESPFFEYRIEGVTVTMVRDPWVDLDPAKELKDAIAPKQGWFRLECSVPLDPRLVLVIYRHRVDIEHLISAIKSVINIAPMRVWTEGSTRGKLVIALITEFILSAAIYDLEPEKVVRRVDGKPVIVDRKPSPKTVATGLREYAGVVSSYAWGGLRVLEARNGIDGRIVDVLDRYESEPPIELPTRRFEPTPPDAQWGSPGKNCKDLAMPISQFFAEEVHPEYMVGRSHWKTEFQAESVYVPDPPKLDPESSGASGLVGRASYYGIGRPRQSEDEQLRNGPPGNPATIPCRGPRRGPSAGSHRTGESRQAQSVGAKLKVKG